MRPSRLEVEGFTSFAQRVEINFDGAGYFALVGPTGAGKSSVIDAITFALYGSVPRYADERLVAPVITQGKLEARVQLEFTVGGERYTAVRVVRRNPKGGATTKEARLEHGDDVIAGNEAEVTERVERLLGLNFDHFTKCVVLPQGAFARFLHDKPKDRQQLLTELLDLGIYDAVMSLAHGRAKQAEAEAALLTQQVEGTAELLAADALPHAHARVDAVTKLIGQIDGEQDRIEKLRDDERRAREATATAQRRAARLRSVAVPAGVADLVTRAATAASALEEAEHATTKAEQATRDALAARADLPDRAPLDTAVVAHRERADVTERLVKARSEHEARVGEVTVATTALEAAEAAAVRAAQQLEGARVADRATDLARTLVAGESCPVCRQTVHELPPVDEAASLVAAEQAVATTTDVVRGARRTAEATRVAQAQAETEIAGLERRRTELDAAVTAHPDTAALAATLGLVEAAERTEKQARIDEQQARDQQRAARDAVAGFQRDEQQAWEALGAVRDDVAELDPPVPSRASLAADWEALVRWASEHAPGQDALALGHEQLATQAADERSGVLRTLLDACAAAGVTVPEGTPGRDAAMRELARAEELVHAIERAHAQAAELTAKATAAEERAQVATALHRHLNARGFENWLLDDAVVALVAHATEVLLALSEGQYSLAVGDKGVFAVVDHRNADERRLARTLSGGETFLASLALALALADQIGSLAAGGAARLESLFLDEGFGTLDADTLETVAATMENLAASGRVVGVITHVRDLADRIPVRFEVSKGPAGSTIERVDA